MASEMVRFSVTLERKTEGAFAEIGRSIERRKSKADFHRILINRIVRLWEEKPQECEQFGLIRRGY